MTGSDNFLPRANAALDGELDAANALAFERELAADASLRAQYERLSATRDAIRAAAPTERAPNSLRLRIEALSAPAKPRARTFLPYALAASFAALAILGSAISLSLRLAAPQSDAALVALVSGYERGQISGQPFDVASSDRHTVKPWLASRVPLGAAVVDLADEGYPLAGGRIDIVGRTPVATLVYRRREHVIAVSELPRGGSEGRETFEGFHVAKWTDAERSYIAVSDIDTGELESFISAFKKGAAQP